MALREPPIEGRGLRILAMDGGGMKGLAMVQILRALERRMCRPLHTVFDLVPAQPGHGDGCGAKGMMGCTFGVVVTRGQKSVGTALALFASKLCMGMV
eukprot:511739-Pelagomonas_calceolata.AAC.3